MVRDHSHCQPRPFAAGKSVAEWPAADVPEAPLHGHTLLLKLLNSGEQERAKTLLAWEEQLHAYSDQLTETGWASWKKGAVTSVMHELQRKMVPDLWRAEVARSERGGGLATAGRTTGRSFRFGQMRLFFRGAERFFETLEVPVLLAVERSMR